MDARARLRSAILQAVKLLRRMRVVAVKDAAEEVDFYADLFSDYTDQGLDGRMGATDLARALREVIRENGRQIYVQAAEDCGVPEEELDDDDDTILEGWIASQLDHVADYAKDVIDARGDEAATEGIQGRVSAWVEAARSLSTMACMNAKKNVMLTFDGDDGEESCDECQEYKGQRHRASWWLERDLVRRNGNENYTCGRWEPCQHNFYTDDGELFGG